MTNTNTTTMVQPVPGLEFLKSKLGLRNAALLPEHVESLESLARDVGAPNLARPQVADKVAELLKQLPQTEPIRKYLREMN